MACADQLEDGFDGAGLELEIHGRRRAGLEPMNRGEVLTAAQSRPELPEQVNAAVFVREGEGGAPGHVGKYTHHADRRRGLDGHGRTFALVLVVKTHVASGDGRVKCAAGISAASKPQAGTGHRS